MKNKQMKKMGSVTVTGVEIILSCLLLLLCLCMPALADDG
jgi:hypothetical protein